MEAPLVTHLQLHTQIIASPGDDELRVVYADALMERGDPRGELIHLHGLDFSGSECLRAVTFCVWVEARFAYFNG